MTNSTMYLRSGIKVTCSYLIEISRDIFSVKDDQGGDGFLVDKILDVAGARHWQMDEPTGMISVPSPGTPLYLPAGFRPRKRLEYVPAKS